MFALEQPIPISNELTMIYIEHKQLAEACSMLFHHLWNKGQDIAEIGENFEEEVKSFAFSSN